MKTDKIITEEAIEILTDEIDLIKGMIYPSDMETTMWVGNRIEAITNAIEALKLHTPTKPNWQGDEKCMDAYCPNCGEYLDDGETPCDKCTQLIDWSDSNE